ncbi:MAG: Gfo/Idh/MocA family oxidoreductase [Deltaproteobacteria bacterium]|uniref:Gfo/Idh/MocA family protein n=1 Tax=Hydrosulfovibrio ferrireducens TaxID=2934181 RepID=UPI0011FBA653|nr:MAG: Gfo/Idh/MocA family oxidoreductase [Deltaproteobacteria bacterium]
MASGRLKVGIAGYGVVGKRRRVFIDLNPHLTTVAVSDIAFGKDGIAEDGVPFFSDFKSLYSQDIDILLVCLPNHLAAEATISGIEKGLHVFCEKPPGRTVEDIRKVLESEKRHPKIKLKYGFNHRYHTSVIEAKRIIDSGQFGKVINIRGVYGKSSVIPFSGGWRSERQYAGGGILLDQGIHMLDMILLFGGDFEEVKSFVSNDYWNHDVEDNAYAIMRNRSGCVAMIHSTATQWQHRFRLEVTLEEAQLELTGILSGSKSYGEEKLRCVPRKDGSIIGSFTETTTSYLEDNSWRDEVDEFADAIVNDKPIESGTSTDALKVMELVYNIYCADQQWQQLFNIDHP